MPTPHVHISATHLVASVAATVAVFGTLHLIALGNASGDTLGARFSRGLISLGF